MADQLVVEALKPIVRYSLEKVYELVTERIGGHIGDDVALKRIKEKLTSNSKQIKDKVDGVRRKELSSSIAYFKEGKHI